MDSDKVVAVILIALALVGLVAVHLNGRRNQEKKGSQEGQDKK